MKIKKILSKENWDRFPYFGFGIIGGIQVFNGLLLIILGIVDVLLHYQEDTVPWPNVNKWNLHRTLTAIDVATWCGVWFMVSGSIAGCIGRGRRIIKALKFTKGVFLFMSLVSALLLAPLSGAVAGYIVILRHDQGYNYKELLIPVSVAFLSLVQICFALLSVGICCCCSDTKSSKGQRILKEEIIETITDKVENEKKNGNAVDTNTTKPATKAEEDKPATREIVVVQAPPEPVAENKAHSVKSQKHCTSCPPQGSHGCCQQTNYCSHGSSHVCNHHFQQPTMAVAPNIIPIIQYPPNYPNIMPQSQQQPIVMQFPFQYPPMQENDYHILNQSQSNCKDTESNVRMSTKKREPRSSEVVAKRSVKLQVPSEIEIQDDDAERPTKQLQPIPRKLQLSNIHTNTYYEEVSEKTEKIMSPTVLPSEDKSQRTKRQVKDSHVDTSTPVTIQNKRENHDEVMSTSQSHSEVPESHLDEGGKVQHTNVDRSYKMQQETPLRSRAVERLIPPEAQSGITEKLVRTHDDYDVKSQTSEYSNDSYSTLKRLALPH